MSFLGRAGYDSDHSDEGGVGDEDDRDSSGDRGSGGSSGVAGGSGNRAGSGEGSGDDEGSDEEHNQKGGMPWEGVVPPPRNVKPNFFMPLPSPLVRLDNMPTPVNRPNDTPNGLGEDGVGGEDPLTEGQEGEKQEEDTGDGDIIDPEYRDMLPPEPKGPPNPQLQSKIAKAIGRMRHDFTKAIKAKKDYGNPAVLTQICRYMDVDDKGTNYPNGSKVHPSVYDTADFHDTLMGGLRRKQKEDEAKVNIMQCLVGSHLSSHTPLYTCKSLQALGLWPCSPTPPSPNTAPIPSYHVTLFG
ncbi:unnamed protein product [Choristocarpus tenellus]